MVSGGNCVGGDGGDVELRWRRRWQCSSLAESALALAESALALAGSTGASAPGHWLGARAHALAERPADVDVWALSGGTVWEPTSSRRRRQQQEGTGTHIQVHMKSCMLVELLTTAGFEPKLLRCVGVIVRLLDER